LFRDGHAFPSVSEYNYIGFGSESETLTVKRQPVPTGHRHYKFRTDDERREVRRKLAVQRLLICDAPPLGAKQLVQPIQTSARACGELTDRAGRQHHRCCLFGKAMSLHRHPQTRYERTTKNNKRNIPHHSNGPLPRLCACTTTTPRLKVEY
jgi:hypothetical protein